MALKLDNLPRSTPIVDNVGRPLTAFQVWWQNFKTQIETSINDIASIVSQIAQILIDLGLAQQTADGALALAESAINPDGTIKSSKVVTESIIADGVTERYLTQTVSDTVLPDTVETTVMSLAFTKVEAESDVDLDIAVRLSSSDDIRGTLSVYRDAGVVDSFQPFMNGAGGTYRVVVTLPFTESGLAAGSYTYTVKFTRNGGASTLSALSGSLIRVKEIKR